MAVLAHPDDETFGCGGTLARYAAEGVQVSLICATLGDAGEITDPSLAQRENLAQVREQELRAACHALGIQDLFILGYRDSGMADSPDNQHPQALCQASRDQVAGQVVEIVRRLQPHVMVTFDPNGGYGHPDHIAIHQATRDAFTASEDPDRYTEQLAGGLQPHRPSKLYYCVFLRSMARAMREEMIRAGIQSDFATIDIETIGVEDGEVTTVVDVGKYVQQKEHAARCHRTQIGDDEVFSWLPKAVRASYLSAEHLVRAEPPFALGHDTMEDDLFGGVDI